MPHYADGTLATIGDLVVTKTETPDATAVLGILVGIQPGIATCNCQVQTLARKFGTGPWIKVGDVGYPDCLTVAQLLPAGAIAKYPEMQEAPA